MFTSSADFATFLTAGRAVFTITSKKTGTRFTFKVSRPKYCEPTCPYFVSVLNGPDNGRDYSYIGFLPLSDTTKLVAGKKGRPDAPCFKALAWVLAAAARSPELPEQLEVRHEGKCGRCGRALTVPESIDSGFGPECITKVGL